MVNADRFQTAPSLEKRDQWRQDWAKEHRQPDQPPFEINEENLNIAWAIYEGRGGTGWTASARWGTFEVAIDSFRTKMYGGLRGLQYDRGSHALFWRGDSGKIQSGQGLVDDGEYFLALRHRHVVGYRTPVDRKNVGRFELFEIGDDPRCYLESFIRFEETRDMEARIVFNEGSARPMGRISTKDFRFSPASTVPLPNPAYDSYEPSRIERRQQLLDQLIGVGKEASTKVLQHFDKLEEDAEAGFRIERNKGASGEVILISWGRGTSVLVDAISGREIGRTLEQNETRDDLHVSAYPGRIRLVPGTNQVAFVGKGIAGGGTGGIWNMETGKLVKPFEDIPETFGNDYAYGVSVDMRVSPNGSEISYRLAGRNETLMAAWNAQTGDKITGNLESESRSDVTQLAWAPDNSFVAILLEGDRCELKHGIAGSPFLVINDVRAPYGKLTVRFLDQSKKALIGNALLDLESGEKLISLPVAHSVSPDGEWVIVETARNVAEIVSIGARQLVEGESPQTPRFFDQVLAEQVKQWNETHEKLPQ